MSKIKVIDRNGHVHKLDMDDEGDFWRRFNIEAGNKRQSNMEKSTKILMDNGIRFHSRNGGIHLIVFGQVKEFDYWPSTGKFINRKTKKAGRGVFNLIKEL